MDPNHFKRKLLAMQKTIDGLLRDLEDSSQPNQPVATCKWCGRPIFPEEKTTRGIHTNPCYTQAFEMVRSGVASWDDLMNAGKLEPKKKVGRKPKLPDVDLSKLFRELPEKRGEKE